MAQFSRKAVSQKSRKSRNPFARAVDRAKHSSFYHDLSLRGKQPLQLLGTPPDLWPGSIRAATQIVSGQMVAGGHLLSNPNEDQNLWSAQELWSAEGLSVAWQQQLHGFDWLRDLNNAVDQNAAKRRAQQLVESWIDHNTSWGEISWRADIVGQRITNWLIYAPLILDSDDVIYRGRVLDIMARSARHLMKIIGSLPQGPAAFKIFGGLFLSGLYVPNGEDWLEKAMAIFPALIKKEILAGGGIKTRNPNELLHLFMDLVTLRAALAQSDRDPLPHLEETIARMATHLKTLSFRSGKLPLFNGVINYNHEDVLSILSRAGLSVVSDGELDQSGFMKLAAGQSAIILDAGPPPEVELSERAHAGTQSFEFARGPDKVIVNCGSSLFIDESISDISPAMGKRSDAHSTLVLDHSDSSAIDEDGFIGAGITRMSSARFEERGHALIESQHDGYLSRYGFLHKRLIYMNEDGEDIRGEDIIEHPNKNSAAKNIEFSVIFHLHPDIALLDAAGSDAVELGLPSGEKWVFSQRGGKIEIGESVYFGDAGKISSTKKISLTGVTSGATTQVYWSLRLDG